MIDDILGALFEDADVGNLSRSRRAQLVFRVLFGVVGAGLSLVGAAYFVVTPGLATNLGMQASMVAVFVFLGCFFGFNVMLARPWRWPWKGLAVSFAMLFATRILFGA